MKLLIKNMVCSRCIGIVGAELQKLGLAPLAVHLGEAELAGEVTEDERAQVSSALTRLGFELYDDRKTKTIARIKLLVSDLVHSKNNDINLNLSEYLTGNLHQDYSAITNIFSQVENITIEQYYIQQKIEKVKELIVYSELSLSQIAYELNYSSVAHLSTQFKKVTGLTPSFYKALKEEKKILGEPNII
jgi:AraC-like DNA-binding protein